MSRSNFPSLVGFTSPEVKEGEGSRLYKVLNCPVNTSEFNKLQYIQSIWILDNYAYPEVFRRIKNNELSPDFKLRNVHIVMYSDESKNEILLNEEVRFLAQPHLKDNRILKEGDKIEYDEITRIVGMYPDPKNDPNTAHLMLTKFNNKWLLAFNLIYNIQKAKNMLNKPTKFIEHAKLDIKNENWISFVENLLFAMTSTLNCHLLLNNSIKVAPDDHDNSLVIFRDYAGNGNIDKKYADHYEKLLTVRTDFQNKKYVTPSDAEDYLNATTEFISYVDTYITKLENTRRWSSSVIGFGSEPQSI